jgi:hypothetical protein
VKKNILNGALSMETEFDDVLYVIDGTNEVYWQISKGVDEYSNPVFNFKTMPDATTWELTIDQFKSLDKSYTFIRSEKEYLAWYLKHGK